MGLKRKGYLFFLLSSPLVRASWSLSRSFPIRSFNRHFLSPSRFVCAILLINALLASQVVPLASPSTLHSFATFLPLSCYRSVRIRLTVANLITYNRAPPLYILVPFLFFFPSTCSLFLYREESRVR